MGHDGYRGDVRSLRPMLDRLVLAVAKVGGRLLGRPSEALLTAMAGRDRPGRDYDTAEPPLVRASHHIQQGQAAFANGAYGEALHQFGVALEHAPEASWAWHGRGDALQLSGQHDAALRAYDQAIVLDDGCGLHHAGRANALASLEQKIEADQAWKLALERDPSLTWMREGSKKT
jgi:tetratricopeptide (TPR) repeat protein